MSTNKDNSKEKVKKLKKIARQQLQLKNLQTKKIPSKKKQTLEDISKGEMIEQG